MTFTEAQLAAAGFKKQKHAEHLPHVLACYELWQGSTCFVLTRPAADKRQLVCEFELGQVKGFKAMYLLDSEAALLCFATGPRHQVYPKV